MVRFNPGIPDATRSLIGKLKIRDGEVVRVDRDNSGIFVTLRYNNLEEWRVIPAFPGYEVSDKGRVRRIANNTIVSPIGDAKSGAPNARYGLYKSGRDRHPYLLQIQNIFLSAFPEHLGSGYSF